jgi:hypothetical protein
VIAFIAIPAALLLREILARAAEAYPEPSDLACRPSRRKKAVFRIQVFASNPIKLLS